LTNHLCLIDDEEILFFHKKHRYRMQVWRGPDLQPVVLVIGIPGSPPPAWYSEALATRAIREFLGFSPPLPIYFEYDLYYGVAQAFRVKFEVSGHPLRPWLSNPTHDKVDPTAIERVFKVTLGTQS
jgi:hypothetical protein